MTLPIAISVPHAGLRIPPEVAEYCQLTHDQIVKDGDEGAAETYDLGDEVAEFMTTDVARAIIDLNRSVDDCRPDGVVKTLTCWNEPVYRKPLPRDTVGSLLESYYHPYHARLSALAKRDLLFAVDCHTMAAAAPPIGPSAGEQRPEVCLGDLHGRSFPTAWMSLIHVEFLRAFKEFHLTINRPFAGGYITQAHCHELPWLQVEISRSEFLPRAEIRARILHVLTTICGKLRRTST